MSFLKLQHSELGDSRWEFICSAATYTEPEHLNGPLETWRVFQHESKFQKKGWQIPRMTDHLAELLVAQEVLKEWLFAYSKARKTHIISPKMCSYTRQAFVMCLLSSIWDKNHQVNCSYKIIKQINILYLVY